MKQLNERVFGQILYYCFSCTVNTIKGKVQERTNFPFLLANIRPAQARTLSIVWGAAVLGTTTQNIRDSKHSSLERKHFMNGGPKITRLDGWNTYLHFSGKITDIF